MNERRIHRLQDDQHRALRTALHGRPVLHARVLDLDDREWRTRLSGSGTTGAPR